jgi:hypothetical protein
VRRIAALYFAPPTQPFRARRYTPARLTVRGPRRYTVVELPLLLDGLGLLRSLQYDVQQYNAAAAAAAAAGGDKGAAAALSPSELRYACFRLTRQAAAFGVRVPRPGTGTVHIPGLDDLIAFTESAFANALSASRTLIAGGIVDFASLAELYVPGQDMLDRGLATGLFGVATAMRVRAWCVRC